MSNIRQQSPVRSERRRRERHMRRLGLEALERRACPAVMFDFIQGDDGGILRITGDGGPNVIEIFQSRDGVVDVRGDGEQRTFEGVNLVSVETGDGDDTVGWTGGVRVAGGDVEHSVHIDVGDGNDTIKIGDGIGKQYITKIDLPVLTAKVNLGTGADEFVMQLNHHDQVELDLSAEDGSDKILIGMLLPAIQKVREASARIDLDVGGGSLVNVRLENIDNVDLSLVSDPASPEPVTGGTINVYWHVINNGSSRLGRNDAVAILKSSLPGGSAVPRTGDTVTFTATVDQTLAHAATSVNAAVNLGPEDDTVSFLSRNVDELQLDFRTGDGDDTVQVASEAGGLDNANFSTPNDRSSPRSVNHHVSIDAGDGSDTVKYKMLVAPLILDLDGGEARLDVITLLGAGDDSLKFDAAGYANVNSFLDAGGGNDRVRNRLYVGTLSIDQSLSQLNVVTLLGAGDDSLEFDTSGYANLSSLIDAGDGDDEVRLRHKMFSIVDRTTLNLDVQLGQGSDSLVIETFNYRDFKTTIDTGPPGDGIDRVTAYHVFMPSRGRVSRIPLTLDGGRDTLVFIAEGYEVHYVEPTGTHDTLTHEVGHWMG